MVTHDESIRLDGVNRTVIVQAITNNSVFFISFNKIVLIATHVVPDVEFIARDVIMLKKGVIADNAPLTELLKKIESGVWIVPCVEEDVGRLQNEYRVTNISRDETTGEVLLRVLSNEKPADNARAAVPTLEDYYLRVFGEQSLDEDVTSDDVGG